MKLKMLSLWAISFVFAGCALFSGLKKPAAESGAAQSNAEQSVAEQSAPEQEPDSQNPNRLVSYPEGGSLIFIGTSGPQIRPEQEIEAAREDAARKVSMYHGIAASFSVIQGIGTNALQYLSSSSLQVDYDRELERYKERLTYNPESDVIKGNGATFIRFTYPGSFPANLSYSSTSGADGSPGWVRSPPREIGGFIAQVGFARRQQRIRDTIIKSSEDAIAGHISSASSLLKTQETTYNDTSTTFVTQESHGQLMYFIILETWIDPNDLSVWTLTVAKSLI